ncbi:MAG: hypothetical protein AAGB04_20975 [Pseudomonadota bacterium]
MSPRRLPVIELVLPSEKLGIALIDRSVASLRHGFRPLVKKLDRAVHLAVRLDAAGHAADAMALLSSFVFSVAYDGDESRWGSVGFGVVYLAFMKHRCAKPMEAADAMALIHENDIYTRQRPRQELVTRAIAGDPLHVEWHEQEGNATKGHLCLVYVSQLLEPVYFLMCHEYLDDRLTDSEYRAIDTRRAILFEKLTGLICLR